MTKDATFATITLMAEERIRAIYRIETSLDAERAAATLAGEQSSGTFVAVPGETEELKATYAARVEAIELLEESASPSLPGAKVVGVFRQANVTVSWPLHNVGHNLPALISTLQGNLYEIRAFSGLKLLDFDLPESFATAFKGPRFGVEGTRRLTGVSGAPMIGTIIKPSVGLTPEQTAEMVATLAAAGIDFIKDDELMGNPPHSPFDKRVAAVMRVINTHADRTGKKVMYAFNVSDNYDEMMRHYDSVVAAGGTCVMASINSVGITGLQKLAERAAVPIHGHRNGWGMLTRHPMLGIEFPAYQKLWRLVGVDQLHVNGIANKFWEEDDSVVRSIESCHAPFLGLKPILPVVSSGQTGLQAPETWRRTQTPDLLYLAGGGIMAHPMGAAAGVAAIRQAWQAAMSGIPLSTHAQSHPELAEQIRKFGEVRQG